jgi:Outer membrane lipoprotein-sorting protein
VKRLWILLPALLVQAGAAALPGEAGGLADATPSAAEIVRRVLNSDPWGLGDADVTARAIVRDESGRSRQLAFRARSLRYDAPLTMSLVRFTAPADLAGVGFLLIQKKDADDERWLYLPELGRSRRIGGDTRGSAFMGTDFSYADLDRRELRYGVSSLGGDEAIDGFPCWKVEVSPSAKEAPYRRIELWVRKDNYVPLQWMMYARSGALLKTLLAQDVRQMEGRWFITKSRMTNHAQHRTTELFLDEIRTDRKASPEEFTVRNLEKL